MHIKNRARLKEETFDEAFGTLVGFLEEANDHRYAVIITPKSEESEFEE